MFIDFRVVLKGEKKWSRSFDFGTERMCFVTIRGLFLFPLLLWRWFGVLLEWLHGFCVVGLNF